MRKIYQKYFEIPEENKGIMGERVFFARLTVAIVCIVLCMSAMGLSAYAFFTASVSSDMNQIQAANYSLSVQSPIKLVNDRGSVAADSTNPNKYTMTQPGMYDFTLIKSGNASTGYCKIFINGNEVAVTKQIAEDALTVRIETAQETVVEFVACWGTYSSEERFDEVGRMVVVDKDKNVSVVTKTDAATVSAPVVPSAPVVVSEPAATSAPESTSVPESTSAPSATITPSKNQDVTATEPPSSTENTEQPDAEQ